MDFCDYGSLVRPILKGMFRPVSASGNDREARVRYRALLRTAKEIAQTARLRRRASAADSTATAHSSHLGHVLQCLLMM
eukprot:544481-Pelagomonas_calceolata.AAC.1